MKIIALAIAAILASCATYEEIRPDGTIIRRSEVQPGTGEAIARGLKIIADK